MGEKGERILQLKIASNLGIPSQSHPSMSDLQIYVAVAVTNDCSADECDIMSFLVLFLKFLSP